MALASIVLQSSIAFKLVAAAASVFLLVWFIALLKLNPELRADSAIWPFIFPGDGIITPNNSDNIGVRVMEEMMMMEEDFVRRLLLRSV